MRALFASCLAACSFAAEPNRSAEPIDPPARAPESGRVFEARLPVGHRSRLPEQRRLPDHRPPPPPVPFEEIPLDMPHGWRPDYYITGQAWGDYDGDGWLDLYLTDTLGPNRLLRNDGRGGFQQVHAGGVELESALSGGALFADYDNDGDKDLLVLNLGPTVLFENRGAYFVDVSIEAGVSAPGKGETAAFGDYDGDGWLDLFIANWFCYEEECRLGAQDVSRSRLYHNDGDGTFTEASALLGLENLTGLGFVASWLDYDNDADLDLYLVNDKGTPGEPNPGRAMNRNLLWRNDGSGCAGWCFTEVGIETGSDARIDGMGLAIGDYDEDGDLDLYMSNTEDSVLYRNDGGTFTDVAREAGPYGGDTGWGTVFFDYDADGDLDIYLAIGRVFGFVNHNRLYENVGGGFIDVSEKSGADDPRYSVGVAYADYDRDGGLDLVVGDWDTGYRIFRNRRAGGGDWLSVRLVGGGPVNRDAVGARATLRLSDGRSLMREVTCGSSLGSGSDLALYFGLGSAEISSLEVRWPDGTIQTFDPPERNREAIITYSL